MVTRTMTLTDRMTTALDDPATHANWPAISSRLVYDVFGRTRGLARQLWERLTEVTTTLDDELLISGLLAEVSSISRALANVETAASQIGLLEPSDADLLADLCDQVDEGLADTAFAVSEFPRYSLDD